MPLRLSNGPLGNHLHGLDSPSSQKGHVKRTVQIQDPVTGLFVDLYHNEPDRTHRRFVGATGATSDVPMDKVGTPRRWWWPAGGLYVSVPEHPEAVLRWRYGDDWRTPRPGFKGRDQPAA